MALAIAGLSLSSLLSLYGVAVLAHLRAGYTDPVERALAGVCLAGVAAFAWLFTWVAVTELGGDPIKAHLLGVAAPAAVASLVSSARRARETA